MVIITRTILGSLISLFLFITLLTGCEPKDDETLVPSYIHIEELHLIASPMQGSNSSNITDAWVYIDEEFIGSFELPATVPILKTGSQKVVVRPGIKLNGIANTRNIYPFYEDLVLQLNLVRDSIIQWTSTEVSYRSNTLFPWMENFNQSGLSLDTSSLSTVNILKTNDPNLVFPEQDNSYSGMAILDNDTSVFEVVTNEIFDFPSSGNPVFLEMNYRNNQEIVIGVTYLTSGKLVKRPMVWLNKTNEWKKVYINLTVPKYDTPNATDFKIFIGALKETGTEDALIYLDNIKLVHF